MPHRPPYLPSVLLAFLLLSGLITLTSCSGTSPVVVQQSAEGANNPFADQLSTGEHGAFFLPDP